MLLRMAGWQMLAVLCGLLATSTRADGEAHNIPPHLLDCYRNESLYFRENRLPSTMPVLVALLRQIEESPGFTMDARSFALSLLHMFRVDGVERDPEVVASEHTIPFGLTGQQYYKHRILMQNLIPRSSFLFPNETLSDVEKCSLHFMMSNSLDKIQRGDEHTTCSVVRYRASPSSRRQRRDAGSAAADDDADSHPDTAAVASDTDTDSAAVAAADTDTVADDDAETLVPSGNAAAAPHDAAASQENHSAPRVADPEANNPDAEMVLQSHELPAVDGTGAAPPKKGNLMWNADGQGPKLRGQLQAGPVPARLEVPQSECPVENGVVHSRWGSVQVGTLLAGIATGFEPQTVAIRDIRAGARAISGLSDTLQIDNRYAATLAGDLAEVALWRGPRNTVKVGASGNWNTSQAHHWYFIGEANEMTDAEIRGGLDGLIMAHHVRDWNSKANGLKLSTILERYYSLRGIYDQNYRACQRQNHYKDVATSQMLNDQTTSFAYGLYDATPSMPTITSNGLSDYASDAVEALDKTVRESSHMETNCDTSLRTSQDVFTDPKLNLIVVVDCGWDYEVITPVLQDLSENINLHPLRSKITVYGAADHELIFDTTDRVHIFSQNVRENRTQYEQCTPRVNMHDLLDGPLRNIFSDQLEEEKENKEADVHSNVVVIIPDQSYDLQGSELRDVEKRMDEYRNRFPDVKFLFFASTSKPSFKIMVEDDERDIIEFHYSPTKDIETSALVQRLSEVPRRIVNPTCGNEWSEKEYAARVYETIPDKHIAYYRIHPKYLFGIGSETIKIKGQGKGTVKVCFSRTDEHPGESDSNEKEDSTCDSVIDNKEYEIQLNSPCGGSKNFHSCNPLYISVEVTENSAPCNENTCKDFDDVAIEFQHSRLTCGAASLGNPIALVAVVMLSLSKFLFNS